MIWAGPKMELGTQRVIEPQDDQVTIRFKHPIFSVQFVV